MFVKCIRYAAHPLIRLTADAIDLIVAPLREGAHEHCLRDVFQRMIVERYATFRRGKHLLYITAETAVVCPIGIDTTVYQYAEYRLPVHLPTHQRNPPTIITHDSLLHQPFQCQAHGCIIFFLLGSAVAPLHAPTLLCAAIIH